MDQRADRTYNQNLESALWDRFRRGDPDAFSRLYDRYASPLAVYGCRMAGQDYLVKDAIQDLFVELWRSRSNLPPVACVNAYLFKAIRYKLLRNEKRNNFRYAENGFAELLTEEGSAETAILRREEETMTSQKLTLAVKRLSLRQQEAVTLKFYHGFSNDQIAEIMGVHYQSATNILHRALLTLRRHFSLPAVLCLLAAAIG